MAESIIASGAASDPLIDTEQNGHGLSLLPCPFCGGRPHQGLMKAERCQLHGEEFQMYRVWCSHGCAQKIGASKDIAYKEWNTRANAETNTRKVSESTPPAGFADPIPATSGAMPSVEDVARLSASEVACYRWPEDTAEHRAMRAAFVDGAAHTVVQS